MREVDEDEERGVKDEGGMRRGRGCGVRFG